MPTEAGGSARNGCDLGFVGELKGHEGKINEVAFPNPDEPETLVSCASDGTIRGWDTRSGQQVDGYTAARQELFTCSQSSHLVAAGSEGKIIFWDRRTHKQCGCFDETHAQDVTQVRFHPGSTSTLVSGSVEGLISVFDLSQGLDEEEGFKAALNIDNSVSRIGFYGAAGQKLWCQTHTETLTLWEWSAACQEDAAGGNGALGEFGNAREALSNAASTALREPCQIDYLVGCEYNAATDQLWEAMKRWSDLCCGLEPRTTCA
ncbi:hypothetical protein WJX72_003515 [[Myrmecia] bisecta]|uniref:Uncharacterized protein n=1 Tax=[Myrmecia] bisecta TaxID=41462 RepID=A0AAW1QEL3_9CHLO